MTPAEYGAAITRTIEDALPRLGAIAGRHCTVDGQPIPLSLRDEVELLAWVQMWADASCGHGGPAGQAITNAPCWVVYAPLADAACVYHRGRLAYTVEAPGDAFWQAVECRRLPGAIDRHDHLSRPVAV